MAEDGRRWPVAFDSCRTQVSMFISDVDVGWIGLIWFHRRSEYIDIIMVRKIISDYFSIINMYRYFGSYCRTDRTTKINRPQLNRSELSYSTAIN